MANPKAAESAAALRMLPSTDDLLASPPAQELLADVGRRPLTALARAAIAELRTELLAHVADDRGRHVIYSKETLLESATERLLTLHSRRKDRSLRRVINATGVVIHTNLGRAPLAPGAVDAIRSMAGYCTLEYDASTGKRGRRGAYIEELLVEITGAEAALVVNNCAAAAFLVLSVFAKGGEAIVSRGELVEIGGDFRIPDVLTQSGATLKEVGTTNRTKISDYQEAIGENTKVLMRVHPSNYRIVGFTEAPSLAELAEITRKHDLVLYEDAGSGALIDLGEFGLGDEPIVGRSIADGADIVTFSGDKLLGGSQAGIIVGRRQLIERIRKHSLYRALRVDKLIYAALQVTLESYLRDDAVNSIPVLRMLSATQTEIEDRTQRLEERLRRELGTGHALVMKTVSGESVIGGGSGPDVRLGTALLSIQHPTRSAAEIEANFRMCATPIIGRIENDRVLLDLRTVDINEEALLLEMLVAVLR
jgi:L-seryl-tRNA(Ser) seleniumtransferase